MLFSEVNLYYPDIYIRGLFNAFKCSIPSFNHIRSLKYFFAQTVIYCKTKRLNCKRIFYPENIVESIAIGRKCIGKQEGTSGGNYLHGIAIYTSICIFCIDYIVTENKVVEYTRTLVSDAINTILRWAVCLRWQYIYTAIWIAA